ncbi:MULTISPECIES: hypothetical protein [Brucella/Ochrobactrum group]|uniref:hypothetical protein n=1 Tax=Brucella/Ochrobactrum group TaxID=2826938 RepID=UPI00124D74D3|nr:MULTISPECIES: hypothetical protein [Brucella/Ochrobactrum group]KAB2680358.1 hypothetical protein F9K78_16860 [Brucella pseudintermedia]NKE74082.1 hypothetical protein [Ochrobactrum sp. MC-1LL]
MSDRDNFFDQFNTPKAVSIIAEKVAGKPCPMCDAADWHLEVSRTLEGEVPSTAFLLKDPRMYWDGAPSIPAVAFSCGNCGFIRLHNIPLVLRGAKANGE